jgi:hypothetical protein
MHMFRAMCPVTLYTAIKLAVIVANTIVAAKINTQLQNRNVSISLATSRE